MLNILKVTDNQTIVQIDAADASFVVGTAGRTRRKLAAVSGTTITILQDDSKVARVEINGSADNRAKAQLYLKYLVQQKHGPVTIDVSPESRDDLTTIKVPPTCVGYITGKKGQGLRAVEEDSGTLMFFSRPEEKDQFDHGSNTNSSTPTSINSLNESCYYTLAIFGPSRNRRAAELRVMCYIEQKINGYFTKDLEPNINNSTEDMSTDIVFIESEDLSYAVGKEGNTRRRLCASSGAVIEYVGNYAYIYGDLNERKRARDYLSWLIAQKTSSVSVDTRAREDVTVVSIPQNVIGYVTGAKGSFLRRVEDETGTFIFIDENKGNILERVLIFSRSAFGRQKARDFIERRMYEKLCGYADSKQYLGNNMFKNSNLKKSTLGISMGFSNGFPNNGQFGNMNSPGMNSNNLNRRQKNKNFDLNNFEKASNINNFYGSHGNMPPFGFNNTVMF
ncbi:KH domain-containing protein [Cryptosporidium muris RN66]|uniref:KH domain-containing protein n=1 Tax=Cryptosporidium muris (strain RN66) TaxID=441375 RepID=B6AGT6_CRYMR|nr:KH domain-containing protein [Cryptosporidium muris RN66]EEA07427.1 KH domain-containing protein [Cryptosporidium muris RN66]|eukprot:XP_002141776.1 KH domain-containing protein [Cryptosporidium muris RN66]